MTFRFAMTGALLTLAAPAAAQVYSPDTDCTHYLTVQTADCVVEHHLTCPAQPGHRWRVDFGPEGPIFQSLIDADAQWIESTVLPGGARTVTEMPITDAASITGLLATGEDRFEFFERLPNGRLVRVEGFDILTGESLVIDGEPLLRTRFAYTITDESGRVTYSSEGQEYVSRRHQRFFSGQRVTQGSAGEVALDTRPVSFAYPGEADFLTIAPDHGCTPLMSALSDRGHQG